MRLLLIALLLPTTAWAQGSAPPVGSQTKAWIDLQTSGSSAEGEARPMDGDVADAVYQRYLESFKHPIPESIGRGNAAATGSSGNGAAGAGESAASGDGGGGR